MKIHYRLFGPFIALFFGAVQALSAQDFKIQIAAFADSVSESYFTDRGIEGITVNQSAGGVWQYFLGYYNTREEAESIQEQLLDRGFSRPVIIDMLAEQVLSELNCAYASGFVAPIDDDDPNGYKFVLFERGKTNLDDKAVKKLDKILLDLKANPKKELRIMGFTDNVGDAESNMETSSQRAKIVRNYFIDRGVLAIRLFIEAYGESEPWYENRDMNGNELPENQRWNNRVMLKYK